MYLTILGVAIGAFWELRESPRRDERLVAIGDELHWIGENLFNAERAGDWYSFLFRQRPLPAEHPNQMPPRDQLVKRGKKSVLPAVEESPTPAPKTLNLDERAEKAFVGLEEEVRRACATGDFAGARESIRKFKETPFNSLRYSDVVKLEDEVASALREREIAEESQRGALGKRFETFELRAQERIASEDFDGAKAVYGELLGDPALAGRAETAISAVERLRLQWLSTTLPARRDLFGKLVLRNHEYLCNREYAKALDSIDTLRRDPALKPHIPMLEEEQRRIDEAAKLYSRIVGEFSKLPLDTPVRLELKNGKVLEGKFKGVKDGMVRTLFVMPSGIVAEKSAKLSDIALKDLVRVSPSPHDPLTLANLFLYETDYPSASEIVIDAVTKDFSAVNEFLARLNMTKEALVEDDLRQAEGEIDKRIAEGKYSGAEEIMRRLTENYSGPSSVPDNRFQAEWLGERNDPTARFTPLREKIEKARDQAMVGTIPYRRLKILQSQGNADEKIQLLKSLKVVGDKEATPYILSALKDESARVQLCAINALAILGDSKITWDLVKAANGSTEEIDSAVVDALRKIGLDIELIKRKFKSASRTYARRTYPSSGGDSSYSEDGDEEERRSAIRIAGIMREEKLASVVRSGLGDGAWRVRQESALAVAKLKDSGSGGTLLNALNKETFDCVVASIAYAMGKVKYKGGAKTLADILAKNPGHPYKQEIVKALGEIGGDSAEKALKSALKDLDPWVRYYALEGLVKCKAKIDEADIKRFLADDRWLNRAVAVTALVGGGNDKSLTTLVRALDDGHQAVRATAYQGLVMWKSEKAITEILRGIEALSGEGLSLALDALKKLTMKDFATTGEWVTWWKANSGNFRLPLPEERFKIKTIERKKQ